MSLSVATFAVLLASSSVEGFTSLVPPSARILPASSASSSGARFSSVAATAGWTIQETATASTMDAAGAASFLDNNLLQEQHHVLHGNAQQQEQAADSSSARLLVQKEAATPVLDGTRASAEKYLQEQKSRKTRVSASVKETGYDSLQNYMVGLLAFDCLSRLCSVAAMRLTFHNLTLATTCFVWCIFFSPLLFVLGNRRNPCAIMIF